MILLYHRVMKTKLMDLIGLSQAEVCGALHCDLKDVAYSFFFCHQTLTEHGTFNMIIQVKNFNLSYQHDSQRQETQFDWLLFILTDMCLKNVIFTQCHFHQNNQKFSEIYLLHCWQNRRSKPVITTLGDLEWASQTRCLRW